MRHILSTAAGRLRESLHRPHSRLRRDRWWIITRLWTYPTLAVCAVFAVVGWTQPEMLQRDYVDGQPVPRVVVER